MYDVRCVAPVGDQCGEAVTWSSDDRSVYWCDVNRFLIHRLDKQARVSSWFFDEPVTALSTTTEPGVMLVALASRLILWRPATDSRREHGPRLSDWPSARFNDGRAAPNGDFWIGSMGNNVGPNGEGGDVADGLGLLHRVRPGGEVSIARRDISISNTVCWSPDRRTFYFGDTRRNTIWAYDYDEVGGAIANERPFFSGFDRGAPDGSCVDAAGRLWNCRFGGGCIVCVGPDGRIEEVLETPATNVTTCAFGGEDLATLYIASAAMMAAPGDRQAGSLFACRPGVSGLDGYRATL